jgi:hypothetical protein
MPEHDPEKLKAFWEYCEAFKGWAKLLLAGNAAGLGLPARAFEASARTG